MPQHEPTGRSALLPVLLLLAAPLVAQDPLPSWNDGAAKRAIVAFGGGEQPMDFQVSFVVDRIQALEEESAKRWTVVDMKADWKTIYPPEK